MPEQTTNRQTGLPTALIEEAARAACEAHEPHYPWDCLNRAAKAHWRRVAIAAIVAIDPPMPANASWLQQLREVQRNLLEAKTMLDEVRAALRSQSV